MIKKIAAIAIMITYSLGAFGESFSDIFDSSGIEAVASNSQTMQCEQSSQTTQIQDTSEQSSKHHSDCADSKNCHHCSACYCGFALLDSIVYVSPIRSDSKICELSNLYLDVTLSGLQRPPRA